MSTTQPTIDLVSSYDICAAHKLYRDDWSKDKNRQVFGHCAQLHGHQYKLEVTLSGPISDETGMLINGYDVDKIIREKLFNQIDHKYLNDDIPFFKQYQPTAEWIAVWAFRELKSVFPEGVVLKNIKIYETPSLFAQYSE